MLLHWAYTLAKVRVRSFSCSSAFSGVSQAPFEVMKFVPANEATLFGTPIGDAERIG